MKSLEKLLFGEPSGYFLRDFQDFHEKHKRERAQNFNF